MKQRPPPRLTQLCCRVLLDAEAADMTAQVPRENLPAAVRNMLEPRIAIVLQPTTCARVPISLRYQVRGDQLVPEPLTAGRVARRSEPTPDMFREDTLDMDMSRLKVSFTRRAGLHTDLVVSTNKYRSVGLNHMLFAYDPDTCAVKRLAGPEQLLKTYLNSTYKSIEPVYADAERLLVIPSLLRVPRDPDFQQPFSQFIKDLLFGLMVDVRADAKRVLAKFTVGSSQADVIADALSAEKPHPWLALDIHASVASTGRDSTLVQSLRAGNVSIVLTWRFSAPVAPTMLLLSGPCTRYVCLLTWPTALLCACKPDGGMVLRTADLALSRVSAPREDIDLGTPDVQVDRLHDTLVVVSSTLVLLPMIKPVSLALVSLQERRVVRRVALDSDVPPGHEDQSHKLGVTSMRLLRGFAIQHVFEPVVLATGYGRVGVVDAVSGVFLHCISNLACISLQVIRLPSLSVRTPVLKPPERLRRTLTWSQRHKR